MIARMSDRSGALRDQHDALRDEHDALRDEHDAMRDLLEQVRVELLGGEVAAARDALRRLGAMQGAHIARENTALIPRLGPAARWPARVYLAEHAKLEALHADLLELLAPLPGRCADARLRLALLDALAPFKHLLEHHFEREQQGLFIEV